MHRAESEDKQRRQPPKDDDNGPQNSEPHNKASLQSSSLPQTSRASVAPVPPRTPKTNNKKKESIGNMKKICEKEKSNSSDRTQIYKQNAPSKESRASNLCTNQKRQTLHELGNVRNTKGLQWLERTKTRERTIKGWMMDG
jgi:hypothetical protein